MKKLTSCMFGAIVLCSASSAWAQERFGKAGQFAIAGERLFGFAHHSFTTTRDVPGGEVETTQSGTTINLLGQGLGFPTLQSVLQTPRVGFDYFIIDGLSLGGSLMFSTTSAEQEVEDADGDQRESEVTYNSFAIAPRIGYALMFNDTIGIWPRGGPTFIGGSIEDDDEDETSISMFALSVEAPLVITPVPHAAFLVGPSLDFAFSGTQTVDPSEPNQDEVESDIKATEIGIQAGILVYF
jgi:hypothetical protein